MTILQELQNAGLPVIDANENGQIKMGFMTPEQEEVYSDVLLKYFQPVVHAEHQSTKAAKVARKDAAITTINGLAGLNLSQVNNNAQKDDLLFAICYLLGICDENGLILEQPIEVVTAGKRY